MGALVLALASLLVVASGIVAVRCFTRTARTASRSVGAEPAGLRFVFTWPRGTTRTYAMRWQGQSRARLADPHGAGAGAGLDLEGRVDLEADLVLRSYGPRGDGYLLGARLEAVTRREMILLGQPVIPTDEAARSLFAGREAWLDVDAGGVVRQVYFAKDAPPAFRHVLKSIAALSQTVIHAQGGADGGRAWSTVETTPVGRGAADYVLEEPNPPRIQRVRRAYDEVFGVPRAPLGSADQDEIGDAIIVLDPSGALRSLEEHETLRVHGDKPGTADALVSITRFTLSLQATGSAALDGEPDLASLDVVRPGDLGGRTPAGLLEARIGGMTAERLERDLRSFALAGSVADDDWLLRASGLLQREPARCLDLVALFEDPAMNARGRAQIMDLLAGTGTPEAQHAMREALDSPAARSDPRALRALVQRFSFVSRPTPDSLAYLEQTLHDAGRGPARWAAAHALGAAAGNAVRAGDRGAAARYGGAMLDALTKARSAEEKRGWLGALGNLGWSDAVPKVVELSHDRDASVRAASARALRAVQTPEAHDALLDLTSDPAAEVEAQAFAVLSARLSLDPGDLAAVSRRVVDGSTSPRADGSLVSLLAAHPEGGPPMQQMLQVLLARNESDKPFAAEIRHLLAAQR
jgi:HEAT repeat protein